MDGLKPTQLKSLLSKFDKHHPELKKMSANQQRTHLLALTGGATNPATPPEKAKKQTKAKGAKSADPPRRLQSEVMDLFRERGKAQDE